MGRIYLEQIKRFCPHCHKYVAFSWIEFGEYGGGIKKYLTDSNCFFNERGAWAIAECPSCENCVLIHFYEDTDGKYKPKKIFPHPLPSPTDDRIPEKIKKDIDEAKICLSVGAFRACAGMCRRALQQACLLKGTSKRNLAEQIDELAEKRIITDDLKEWAHTIRWIGNDALHPELPEVKEDEAKDILNLTERFMEVIFAVPERIKKLRKNHGKGEKNDRRYYGR